MLALLILVLGVSAVFTAPVEDPGELGDKFEGDIVLPHRKTRTGLLDVATRWPNKTLPYVFQGLNKKQAAFVRKALNEMEEVSCIKFVKRRYEPNFITVTVNERGCFSSVGMDGGEQQLNLASDVPGSGCFQKGSIMHEFLHALGLYHMQSATERDDFVEIVWKNIKPAAKENFETFSASTISEFGVPYDYGSVMHYSPVAFSNNGKPTIIARDPKAKIGQRIGMSKSDIKRLNNMYCKNNA